MEVITPFEGGLIKAWTGDMRVEPEAMVQLCETARLPFIYKWLAVMPDVHWGNGATIGSVLPTVGAVVPAAVGVDIGCGMSAVRLNLTGGNLIGYGPDLRERIEEAVPHGRSDNGGPGDVGAWQDVVPEIVFETWNPMLLDEWVNICENHPRIEQWGHPMRHLGTLGTGNHFIELCLDEEDKVWVMLHSGSRGIGNRIGTYFIKKAKEECEQWFVKLPNKQLAYFPEHTELHDEYIKAVKWAQLYAENNRQIMMHLTMKAVAEILDIDLLKGEEQINCHHNFIQKEHHYGKNIYVTRKGATSARKGQMGIIPGSMGTRSYIVEGKGNPESFNSCSHGAGRAMSRRQARDKFTLEDHAKATEGVECRKDADVIDETPGAYKDIDAVMEAQKDLVDIKHTLKGVVCVKG